MVISKETLISKDEDKKQLRIVRDFDAPVNLVWRAWTEPALLDQWWAPKPWQAVTQEMDFREGGRWRYYMLGPEGERHYCLADYETINKGNSYTGYDAFCDEKGNINTEFPRMHWSVQFSAKGDATRVDVEVTFQTLEDLNKIVEMGFKEGFTMAHGNLDELLEKEKA